MQHLAEVVVLGLFVNTKGLFMFFFYVSFSSVFYWTSFQRSVNPKNLHKFLQSYTKNMLNRPFVCNLVIGKIHRFLASN